MSGEDADWGAPARHGVAIATVRAFTEASGADRVAVVLDGGGAEAVVLECLPGAPLELTAGGDTFAVPADATQGIAPLAVKAPLAPPASAIDLDLEAGEVHAPIGVLHSLADGLLALARALGGRTVATADFPTREPGRPLTLAARDGEGVVVALGDQHFEL